MVMKQCSSLEGYLFLVLYMGGWVFLFSHVVTKMLSFSLYSLNTDPYFGDQVFISFTNITVDDRLINDYSNWFW